MRSVKKDLLKSAMTSNIERAQRVMYQSEPCNELITSCGWFCVMATVVISMLQALMISSSVENQPVVCRAFPGSGTASLCVCVCDCRPNGAISSTMHER